jgi:hypothetical protein
MTMIAGVVMMAMLSAMLRGLYLGMVMVGSAVMMTLLMAVSVLGAVRVPIATSAFMFVVVLVVMPMRMTMVMMIVIMIVMIVAGRGVAVGFERCGNWHRLNTLVRRQRRRLRGAQHPHPVGEDLHRYMPVAKGKDEARRCGKVL